MHWTGSDPDRLAIEAKEGSESSYAELWEHSLTLTTKLSHFFHRRYPWIDAEDLSQNAVMQFPKIINRFDPARGIKWSRYAYYAFYRACQDALRSLDPLGIKHPHKPHYPGWCHISQGGIDEGDRQALDSIINDGINRLDRGVQYGKTPET